MKKTRVQNIASLVSMVVAVGIAAKLFGFVREALQARTFGIEAETDLYTAAFNATIYLFTTFAYALCVAAVPILSRQLKKSRAAGFEAANHMITVAGAGSVCLTALAVAFPGAYLLVTGGGTSASAALIGYVRVFLPPLIAIVPTYLYTALLQALEHYLFQGMLSLPYNAFLIVYLIFFARRYGLKGLAVVVGSAWVLQLLTAVPVLRREGYRPRLVWSGGERYLGAFFKTALVTAVTTAVFLFCYLTDFHMASGLGEGTSSAFYYADKLFTPIATTLVYGMSAVLFPKFNLVYLKTDPGEYRAYVGSTLEKMILVLLPLSALFSAFARPIVYVCFQGGNFSSADTAATGALLSPFALGLTGFAVLDLLCKAFYTIRKTAAPLICCLGAVGLNALLDVLLPTRAGGAGLAFCTALSLSAGAAALAWIFFRKTGAVHNDRLRCAGKSILASLALYAALAPAGSRVMGALHGKLSVLGACLLIGILGMAGYVGLLCLMGEKQAIKGMFARERETVS